MSSLWCRHDIEVQSCFLQYLLLFRHCQHFSDGKMKTCNRSLTYARYLWPLRVKVLERHLRGPVTLTPNADSLAVEMSLPVLTTYACRGWDSNTQPSACGETRGKRVTQKGCCRMLVLFKFWFFFVGFILITLHIVYVWTFTNCSYFAGVCPHMYLSQNKKGTAYIIWTNPSFSLCTF